MAKKKHSIPSLDELQWSAPSNKSGLPTFDEVTFGRQVERRTARNESFVDSWDITIPKDVEKYTESELDSVGSELITAPTTNSKRPRALTIGYNPSTRALIVVFRDNTWWQYNDVPAHIWIGLKSSASTGEFLRVEGLDTWPDMGPADLDAMSAGVKAQISESSQLASKIQKSTAFLESKKNIQSFTSEELFKDYL